MLDTPVKLLIGEDGRTSASVVSSRRSRRGPASRLEQQLDAITRLPKAKQKVVSELIDSVIVKNDMEAQYAARSINSGPHRKRPYTPLSAAPMQLAPA